MGKKILTGIVKDAKCLTCGGGIITTGHNDEFICLNCGRAWAPLKVAKWR